MITGLRRSPGQGNGNPLEYSSLENSKDRGARPAIVYGVTKKLDMTSKLNNTKQPQGYFKDQLRMPMDMLFKQINDT